jgi:hypothetical protein
VQASTKLAEPVAWVANAVSIFDDGTNRSAIVPAPRIECISSGWFGETGNP